jgi:hypothetical protein
MVDQSIGAAIGVFEAVQLHATAGLLRIEGSLLRERRVGCAGYAAVVSAVDVRMTKSTWDDEEIIGSAASVG